MQVSGILGSFGNGIYRHNNNFNGHFRSVEINKSDNDVFQAKTAGSNLDSGACRSKEEAVYFAIKNSNDYVCNNKIEKLRDINSEEDTSVAEVYFTDKDENIIYENIEPYADYIVYANGAGNILK